MKTKQDCGSSHRYTGVQKPRCAGGKGCATCRAIYRHAHTVRVGVGFYVFTREFLGPGYELERHWVSQMTRDGYRHIGGACDSPEDGSEWAAGGDPDPEKAFENGKKRALSGFTVEKNRLRDKLAAVMKEERKMRALRLKDVRLRGSEETFEQFMRNWETDF